MVPYSETEYSRRDFVKLSTAALATPALLAGCGGSEPEEKRAGGSVRFLSAENFWANWDPYQANALSQFRLNKQVYDFLLDFPDGDLTSPAPMLATEWEQRDPRTWEFKLREGVKFHDGTPFNADAVVFNFQRLFEPDFEFGFRAEGIGVWLFPNSRHPIASAVTGFAMSVFS